MRFQVIAERLSDGSEAWNVQGIFTDGVGSEAYLVIGAIDRARAEEIAAALNHGAVFVQVE